MELFRLAALSLWFLIAWVSLAHAGPLVPLIGAIGSFLASGTILSQLAVGLLLTGVRLGVSLLMGGKKETKPAGIQQDVKFGGNNPLSFIMGRFATPGQLEYGNTWGKEGDTPNAYLTRVISISDIPCEITGIWVDETHCDMPTTGVEDPGFVLPQFTQDGKNYAWIKPQNGNQTDADAFLISKFGNDAERPWLSDMIGKGVPYFSFTTRFNQKLFNGAPTLIAETDGIPLYDPRKDSSVGGEGAQRWNDYSTFEPSSNLVVQIYNIYRGIRYEEKVIWGGGYEAYQLPLANWMSAMNTADISVALVGGGTEPQYRGGIEIEVNEEPASIIEELAKAGNAYLGESGGFTTILIGSPGAAVYSFTDSQIIVTEEMSLDPFPGITDTYNGASASYPEPEIKWGPKDAPQYIRSDYEVLDDGRQLLADIQYRACPYPIQVQRLMKQAVEDYRRFKVHQFCLPPEALFLGINDVVSWTSAYNQYESKKFLISSAQVLPNLLMLVTLKEIDPADNAWDPETDQKDYSLGPISPIVPPAQPITGWAVAPKIIYDSEGEERRPTIEVFFKGDLDDIEWVHVWVRLKDDPTSIIFDSKVPYGEPLADDYPFPKSFVLPSVFLPDEDYEVQGQFVPFVGSDRPMELSAWLTVHTDNVLLGLKDVYPIDISEIAKDLAEFDKWVGESIRAAREELERIDQLMSDQNAWNYKDKMQLRRELLITTGDITAAYTEAILVATGPDSALATRVEDLEVSVNDPETGLSSVASAVSSLTVEVSGQGDDIEANAQAIDALSVTVGEISSSVGVRAEAVASPGGGWARWGVQVKTGSGDEWSSSSFFIDANTTTNVSRVVFEADQFIITDGDDTTQPFVFTGGVAYMENANIGTVKFNQLESNNGKLILRGSGTFADISIFV